MSILPKNEKKIPVDTPSNFFIYGASMHGKSFLAGEFPNPLFLDTDGNASANPHPSIQLRNIRGTNGKIKHSAVEQLDQIITELQTKKHSYETVVLDVIDDIVVMIEQYICDRENVEALADIGYGKGYATFNSMFQQLVIELKALPMNVVYISRISTYEQNNLTIEEPSLKEKHVNIVNGNCDYRIQCKKIGKNYLRITKLKRKNYTKEQIDDDRITKILVTVQGAFEPSKKVDKSKQEKIVKKMQEEEERIAVGEDSEGSDEVGNDRKESEEIGRNRKKSEEKPKLNKQSSNKITPRKKPVISK